MDGLLAVGRWIRPTRGPFYGGCTGAGHLQRSCVLFMKEFEAGTSYGYIAYLYGEYKTRMTLPLIYRVTKGSATMKEIDNRSLNF